MKSFDPKPPPTKADWTRTFSLGMPSVPEMPSTAQWIIWFAV